MNNSNRDFFIELASKINSTKPGLIAQLKMVPEPRPGHQVYTDVENNCLKAGVLLLLYPYQECLHLLLTLRTENVLHHRAQISFPGGRQENGETLDQTALRETQEELGISIHSLFILGKLTPLFIPPSNYCIYPLVATAPSRPDFRPHCLEVKQLIEVPLNHLIRESTIQKEWWTRKGKKILVPFYYFQGHKIWGATAMVLAEFLTIVEAITENEYNF